MLRERLGKDDNEASINLAAWKLSLDTALMMDAVSLFAHTLSELEMTNKFEVKPLSCAATDNWEGGLSVINLMKTVKETNVKSCFIISKSTFLVTETDRRINWTDTFRSSRFSFRFHRRCY